MITLENALSLVPDYELKMWLYDFFVQKYGPQVLFRDIEQWYLAEGGSYTQSQPFLAVVRGNTTTVSPITQYSFYGGYKGPVRAPLLLYSLVSLLHSHKFST